MDNTIQYKSLPFENTIEVGLKEISFEVQISDSELWIDINKAWKNDMDSTPIELNDKLKTELLCLMD